MNSKSCLLKTTNWPKTRLLLDRIVRQGRAFGVHAIMGSQTLGGVRLGRSTMGQMQIKWPCSALNPIRI